MDALRLLDEQHEEITRRFGEVEAARDADRPESYARLATVLAGHMRLEEQVFYPAVASVETQRLLVESLEQHLAMKRSLSALRAMPLEDARFDEGLGQLRRCVERHIEVERRELFPRVRRLLDPEQRDALGEDLVVSGLAPA